MNEPNLTSTQPPISGHQVPWFLRQLKFVIWFPMVLVAAFTAGYLFWQKTLVPGPYDLEPVNIVRRQTAESLDTSNWQTYRNEKYGFEIKLSNIWAGYFVNERPDSVFNALKYLDVRVPAKDGYAAPLIICMYPKDVWDKLKEEPLACTFINQNDKYVFGYGQWQDPPQDLINKNFDIPKILSTFKFIK